MIAERRDALCVRADVVLSGNGCTGWGGNGWSLGGVDRLRASLSAAATRRGNWRLENRLARRST